jgi:hypothetical protein
MAAAGIISALSSVVSGVMGMMQASYQAEVANRNARVAEMNAEHSLMVASIKAEDQDMQSKALKGEQLSTQAASGVTLSGDSQVLTRATATRLGRRDALNIIDDGNLEAYNYREQAANFKMQAGAAQLSGMSSLVGGFLGAAGGLAGASPNYGSSFNGPRPVPKPSLMTSYMPSSPLLRPNLSYGGPH